MTSGMLSETIVYDGRAMRKFRVLLALAVGSMLVLAMGCTSEKQVEQEIQSGGQVISVTATKLHADYDANAVAADERYKDKVLEVTGKVTGIGKDIMDTPYVTLDSGNQFMSVQCMFADEHKSELSGLSKGQTVTIVGKCDGQLMGVLLRGCRLQ